MTRSIHFKSELKRLQTLDYARRRIARTEIDGLTVSTCWTRDGTVIETAILDQIGSYPVQRYKTEAEAEAGHKAWVAKVPGLQYTTIIDTVYPVRLVRRGTL